MHKMIPGLVILVMLTLVPAASAQTGKHVAIGAGITASTYVDDDFKPHRNPSPTLVYRFNLRPGKEDGWSWEPSGGFGWFKADADMAVGGLETRIGRLRARPFMGGIERAYRRGPMKVGLSLVAGPSFNHVSIDQAARVAYATRLGRELTSIKAKTSLAVRPELSAWYDLGEWFALRASLNYMYNRPNVETTAGGTTSSEKWNTDHVNLHIGFVVGIF